MKIYLLRHGEYAILPNQIDSLTEKGRMELSHLAKFLDHLNINVSTVFHSGRNRARQTAEIVAQAMHCQDIREYQGLNPLDDVSPLVVDLFNIGEENLLIVSHLPFLSRLVSRLVLNAESLDIVNFNPGTLVALEKLDHSRFVIEWVINPALVNA